MSMFNKADNEAAIAYVEDAKGKRFAATGELVNTSGTIIAVGAYEAGCRRGRDEGKEERQAATRALDEAIAWIEARRDRLHADDCSVHIPSARCSCGLHRVLTGLRAVSNGNAALFFLPADLEEGRDNG